ncbi:MAG: hypothetical protein AAB628_02325 [Patescibacteria group bacterium]
MIEIIPAVMPKSFDDLVEKAGFFAGVVPLIQLDIMDGKFVPARTWPYHPGDEYFKEILSEERGMPEWDILDYEVDLMIEKPEEHVLKWVMAGALRIIVHVEGMKDFETIRNIVPKGLVELGLAINTTTPLSALEPYLDRVDFVQCMGIEKIGFQGEAFDERVLGHVRSIRTLRPDMPISIDGAVSMKTAETLVEAGATRLVAGSAILKSGDVSLAVLEMRNLVS